jgi:hypothetical protein
MELLAEDLPEPLERWVREHWQFPLDLRPAVTPLLHLTAVPGPPITGISSATPGTARLPGISLPCTVDGGSFRLGTEAAGAHLTAEDENTRIEIWGGGLDPDGIALAALFVALAEAMRWTGLVPLHAAVIVKNGAATALLGPSGIGKSTSLLKAISQGWEVLAEDFAWLDPDSLAIYGWDRGIHLWPDALERIVPEFAARAWKPGTGGKLFLDFGELQDGRPRPATLTRIAVLGRSEAQPTAWSGLPAFEAVRALWEAIGVPLAPRAREMTGRLVAELIQRVEIRRLTLGRTPLPI